MRRFLLRLAWLAILACMFFRMPAFAAGEAERLTVQAVFDGQLPLAGMRFSVYRVAVCADGGAWSPEPQFMAYRTRLEPQQDDAEGRAALARVLEKIVQMDDHCLPVASSQTDEQGTAVLDMPGAGMYLLCGQNVCENRQIYTPSPLLLVCPTEREAQPDLIRSPEKADYSVRVIWDDDKTPAQRPQTLTVQLMCDGKAYGRSVHLSGAQEWRHTWSSLPTAHYWALTTQELPGYLPAEMHRTGTEFLVTCSAARPEPHPEAEAAPESGNHVWLAALAFMLMAAAGVFLRYTRKKSKRA